MLFLVLSTLAAAAPIPVTEVRGGVVRGVVGFPDLVGGEVGAHFGGWHLAAGYSNLIIINSAFLRGGPEWVVWGTERNRGTAALLFSPSVEYRLYSHSHVDALQHGASLSAGLELMEPLGGGWVGDLRLDLGAVYLNEWTVLPYGRLSFGVGRVPGWR